MGNSCLDRISFDVGDLNTGAIVITGQITDNPGPYTVNIYRSSNVDDDLFHSAPYLVKRVTLSDDQGNEEDLEAAEPGTFKTKENGIKGETGHSYQLTIELFDGGIFKSSWEEIKPVGAIEKLYYEFESIPQRNAPDKYGFRVFVDATTADNNYVRWKYTGTYKVLTYPERHQVGCEGQLDPFECSGYVAPYGILTYTKPCECCYCWVTDYENAPHLNDREILTDGEFKRVELGFVGFNAFNFSFYKYMLKVEQMSLSQEAYEFWKIIRDQKTGLTSLFQPAFGKTRTNFSSTNSRHEVVGIFYASAVTSEIVFIKAADAPLSVPIPTIPPGGNCSFKYPCDKVFANASRTPPPEWE